MQLTSTPCGLSTTCHPALTFIQSFLFISNFLLFRLWRCRRVEWLKKQKKEQLYLDSLSAINFCCHPAGFLTEKWRFTYGSPSATTKRERGIVLPGCYPVVKNGTKRIRVETLPYKGKGTPDGKGRNSEKKEIDRKWGKAWNNRRPFNPWCVLKSACLLICASAYQLEESLKNHHCLD